MFNYKIDGFTLYYLGIFLLNSAKHELILHLRVGSRITIVFNPLPPENDVENELLSQQCSHLLT